jgi:hypothetical protein
LKLTSCDLPLDAQAQVDSVVLAPDDVYAVWVIGQHRGSTHGIGARYNTPLRRIEQVPGWAAIA